MKIRDETALDAGDDDDEEPDPREEFFAALDALCEEERYDEALEALEELDEDDGERWLYEASVLQELGDPAAVEDAFERAREALGDGDAFYRLQRGAYEILCWNLEEAHLLLDSIRREEMEPASWAAVLDRRAFLAEVEGDFERADALYASAHAADETHPAPPPRISEDAFEAVVAAAAEELPPVFRKAFETIPVVIDPMPTRAIVGGPGSGFAPDLLGLYEGPPLADFLSVHGGGLPPRIHLFQRNLERDAPDTDELREEIRVTLFHELGHALGFDEDEVDEMGLA